MITLLPRGQLKAISLSEISMREEMRSLMASEYTNPLPGASAPAQKLQRLISILYIEQSSALELESRGWPDKTKKNKRKSEEKREDKRG
jgi:hypothetical protein